jgi:hypothetical protein
MPGDITVVGADLYGGNGIALSALGDINLLAQEQRYRSREENHSAGWNAGVALSFGNGFSFGITAGGNYGEGFADGDATTWRNTHLTSDGLIAIDNAGDTRLIGAQVKGEEVQIDTRNLTIESLQDTATFESEQMNVSGQVTVGYGFSASASYGQSKIESDYASVTEQSGIFAGDGGYRINVREHTDLTGALVTSSQEAEDEGKNSLSTGTLTARDLYNVTEYEADGFALGAGVRMNADLGLGEHAAVSNPNAKDKDGNLKTGAESTRVGASMGYGRDADKDKSVTRSGINTANVTITDEAGQLAKTGKSAEETLAALLTSVTSDTAEANSGALKNNFDREKVEDEISLQVAVTQQFSQNVQYVTGKLRASEQSLRNDAEKAEAAANDAQNPEEAAAYRQLAGKLNAEADDWQTAQIIVAMVAGGLSAPTDSLGGIVASTLAPAISYEIGKYFKERDREGSPAHILAHAVLGGAVAAAGGNDALSGALAAGGAEALAPVLSNFLYGTSDASELTPSQKETITAIASLAGSAIGGAVGGGAGDVVASGQAAQNAVANNAQLTPGLIKFLRDPDRLARYMALYKEKTGKTITKEEAQKYLDRFGGGYYDKVLLNAVNDKEGANTQGYAQLKEMTESFLSSEGYCGITECYFKNVTEEDKNNPSINLNKLYALYTYSDIPEIEEYMRNISRLLPEDQRQALSKQGYYDGAKAGFDYASEQSWWDAVKKAGANLLELPSFVKNTVLLNEGGLIYQQELSLSYPFLLNWLGLSYEAGYFETYNKTAQWKVMTGEILLPTAGAYVLKGGAVAVDTIATRSLDNIFAGWGSVGEFAGAGEGGLVFRQLQGLEFEQAALDVLGVSKNTKPVTVTLESGKSVTTIPDGYKLGSIIECKDVCYLSMSDQFRAYGAMNKPIELIVSPNTQKISGPLFRLINIDRPGSSIRIYNPETGTFTPWNR